jgi:molybdopterin biosynthesis enzyme
MPDNRETFWPAQVQISPDGWQVQPLAWQSSGDLRGLVGANALLPIAPGTAGQKHGAAVPVLWLPQ